MNIKSIVAAAGVVLLATAGAAQAGEQLTATGESGAAGFSALNGASADPMSIEELDDVRGRLSVYEVLDAVAQPPDPCLCTIPAPDAVGLILMEQEVPITRF